MDSNPISFVHFSASRPLFLASGSDDTVSADDDFDRFAWMGLVTTR